jgi:hypothetical protein
VSFAPRPAALFLLALLVLSSAPAGRADADLRCAICGQPITGRYIEVSGRAYHESCYAREKAPRCAVCGEAILGRVLQNDGRSYHEKCYRDAVQPRCAVCGKPIEGKYVEEAGKSYHPACHRSRMARCVICGQPLEGSYLADPWGHPFHARHTVKVLCPFCGRAMADSTTHGSVVSAENGMRICVLCDRRRVEGDGRAQTLLERARLQLLDSFPVDKGTYTFELVPKSRLDALLGSRRAGNELGLTVERKMRRGRHATMSLHVYLLSGLPDWLFEAVAAHELAHVWQHLQGLEDLPLEQAEGSAELAAYLTLRRSGGDEGRIKIQVMQASDDPIYGKGFRKALDVSMKGSSMGQLRAVLKEGKGWPRSVR